MKDIEEIKKDILEHDRRLNEEEIKLLDDIKSEIDNFLERINDIKDYVEYLRNFNLYEIKEKPRLKEEEIDILYELYSKFNKLEDSFSSLYEKLLRYYKIYYKLVKEEII